MGEIIQDTSVVQTEDLQCFEDPLVENFLEIVY